MVISTPWRHIIRCLWKCPQEDVKQGSSRGGQAVFKRSSRCLQEVSSRGVFKRCLQQVLRGVFKQSSRCFRGSGDKHLVPQLQLSIFTLWEPTFPQSCHLTYRYRFTRPKSLYLVTMYAIVVLLQPRPVNVKPQARELHPTGMSPSIGSSPWKSHKPL
jgi:hypothetical protein